MRTRLLPALLTLLLCGAAHAQASYTHFGSSCLTLDFHAVAPPRIGQPLVLMVPSGFLLRPAGGGQSFLLTGASNRSFGGVPLPFDISHFSSGREVYCGQLLTSSDFFIEASRVMGLPVLVALQIPIPNDPALVGASIYQQVLTISSWSQWDGSMTSLGHGGHGVIGR